MYGYNTQKKDTSMRTRSDMSFKAKIIQIADSPSQRQSPLGVYHGENLRDSIKKNRESEVHSSLDKKKA